MTLQDAVTAALVADNNWIRACELAGLGRWSKGSHGEPGTPLRKAYYRKLAADIVMHHAFDADRKVAAEKREELRNEITNQGDC